MMNSNWDVQKEEVMVMTKRTLLGMVFAGALCSILGAVNASADSISYDLTVPNSQISGLPAPYAKVTITTTGSKTATVTFERYSSYVIIDSSAVALNTNGAASASGFSWIGGNANTHVVGT